MQTNVPAVAPRRRIGLVAIVLMGAGGLLLLVVLAAVAFKISGQRALNAELARIRAAGEPASSADLEAYYQSPPAGQDTTQLWLEATAPLDTPQFQSDAKALPIVGEEPGEIPLPGESWPQLKAAEQLLSEYGRSLELMHQAARQGGRARYPTRFADGLAMLMPHVQGLRNAARLLALQAAVEAHRERPDAAVDAVIVAFAAARSLEQEPITVSQLVRMAIDSTARDRVGWLLSALALDDAQLARLDGELKASDYRRALRCALLGERVFGIVSYANPATLFDERDMAVEVMFAIKRDRDEAMYLKLMSELIAAADKPGEPGNQATANVEAQLQRLRSSRASRITYPLTLLLMPALNAAFDAASRNEASRDATRAAVAVERFRLAGGRLPEKLDELAPKFLDAVPIDPFDGGPLRYRVDEAEYLIYGVGKDGTDQQDRSESHGEADDIAVRVRRRDAPANSAGPQK